jgi:thiamine-phosphate diphosphorylase
MRPLPRVHAFTTAELLGAADFAIRAAAIASGGPAVALHARAREVSGQELTAAALRVGALVRPPEATLFISGRPDIAAALGAQGVQLSGRDLAPADARRVMGPGWIGCSVHSVPEGERALAEGADFLVVGSIFETASHPGYAARGLSLISDTAALGKPVIAIGGITPERAWQAREAGAYGVAAISALWSAADPAAATMAILGPWVAGA